MKDHMASESLVSIVIPVHNEEEFLESNLSDLATFFDGLLGPNRWLFVLAENASTDRTPQVIAAVLRRWPLSRAIHLAEPNYGAALKAGLKATTTRWVFMIDVEQ